MFLLFLQNFEMSRKKYANCDEISYDDDVTEIIDICQQTNKVCQDQGSSVPEEAEENNASYKYVYPRSDLKGILHILFQLWSFILKLEYHYFGYKFKVNH